MATRTSARNRNKPKVDYYDNYSAVPSRRRTQAFSKSTDDADGNEADPVEIPAGRKQASKSADQELRRPKHKASHSKKRTAKAPSNIADSKKGIIKKQKFEDSRSTNMGEENRVVPIDSFIPDRDRVGCNVFCDSEGPWDVFLHKTNARSKKNKYVLIQLIQNTKSGFFYIWSRCGEIGDSENHRKILSYFSTIHSAKKNFEKQFEEKTKNSWPCSFEDFVKHSGKYYLKERNFSTSVVKVDRAIDFKQESK